MGTRLLSSTWRCATTTAGASLSIPGWPFRCARNVVVVVVVVAVVALKRLGQWFLKAAERGNVRAQHRVGLAVETGRGVAKDVHQALLWYHKAADNDSGESWNRIGRIYDYGACREESRDEREREREREKSRDNIPQSRQRLLPLADVHL